MTEDPVSERTGLFRRTTLGRNEFQRDGAVKHFTEQTREGADGVPPLPPTAPKRFKAVSTLVIAMNRFKGDSASFPRSSSCFKAVKTFHVLSQTRFSPPLVSEGFHHLMQNLLLCVQLP